MTGLSVRRVFSAAVLLVALAAFAMPGVASAKKIKGVVGEKCSSETAVAGEGSSAQKLAQQTVWIPGFEKSNNIKACNGTQGGKKKPKLTYGGNGSGAGLKAFGAEGEPIFHGKEFQYAGTDEPPNATQKAEIEAHGTGAESLETLPVLQFAVAVIINLPEGCTATSTADPGRLVLSNKILDQIWKGELKTWGEVIAAETAENPGGGDKISPAVPCLEDVIKHVVRFDQSGTTHVFKKYLGLISTTKIPYENFKKEGVGSKNWDETAEGAENQSWPVADAVIRPGAKGGGEVVNTVVANPSSIGYANLADARGKFGEPTGGHGKQRFWVELQNTGTGTEKETGKKNKYADPATNKEEAALANSNCVKEKYTNGVGTKFPPKTVHGDWSPVTTATKQKAYPLCGLTYDLVVTPYKLFTEPPAAGQATTVVDLMEYILSEEVVGPKESGGQVEIENADYERIPSKLDKEALKGLEEVSE